MQEQELRTLLEKYEIPFETWGTGQAKTFNHLLAEINDGEAVLTEHENRLLRSANGSIVMVYYRNGQSLWQLKEDRQVFSDGRERRRTLATSIGEKMQPGESSIDAAHRALREEIGIDEKLPLIQKPMIIKGPIPSESYPGLFTRYVMHAFDVFLPDHHFKPEGYIEKQQDKTNYYIWVEV
jgi:hypothetical protein